MKKRAKKKQKKQTASVHLDLRITPGDKVEAESLARYLRTTISALVRRLIWEERGRLEAQGLRPPKK